MERIAILRFENLGPDSSSDWMGRAFSEILTTELSHVPGLYAIPASRIHAVETASGARPVAAPGISAERAAAIGAGASEIVFGQYFVRGGTLTARMTLEDQIGGKATVFQRIATPAGDIVGAASALARQISAGAKSYGTANAFVVETHVKAFENLSNPETAANLEKAIAADPDFGPDYRQLAQIQVQHKDVAGALATLARALARGDRIPPMERALTQFDEAILRNDISLRIQALTALTAADPNDPATWQELGAADVSTHRYSQGADAFRKAVAIQPNDGTLWNLLGYAAAYAGDAAAATDAIDRYVRLAPTSPNASDSLGDVNLIAGHLPAAQQVYSQNARKYPDFFAGLEYLKAAMARLMTGDVSGADVLAQQYFDSRAAAKDPVLDYRKAQWAWISGRRKDACAQMARLVAVTDTPTARAVAVHASADLAIWTLMLGNRQAAAGIARQSVELAKSAPAPQAALAQFFTQPPASAAEWQARARVSAPAPAEQAFGTAALADALLFSRDFAAALPVLKSMYDNGNTSADEGLPVLLAWAYVETGHIPEAAELLRSNPPLSDGGLSWSTSLYFPRIFYLRAVVAQKQGNAGQASENFRIFHALSGPDPLMWGEEQEGK